MQSISFKSVKSSRFISSQVLPKKIVIFGGNGYIGQNVAIRALQLGLEVTSISRTGSPAHPIAGYTSDWVKQVKWEKGDVLDFSPSVSWKRALAGQEGAVSCIGAFGSNEFMTSLNGHANVNIAKLTSEAGIKNFVFVSADGEYVPSFILKGYFDGKRLADEAVSFYFKGAGVILRPGFVYGARKVGGTTIPLQCIGRPLEWLLCSTGLSKLKALSSAVPVSVQDVAIAAVAGAMGELEREPASAQEDHDGREREESGAAVECRHDEIVAIGNTNTHS